MLTHKEMKNKFYGHGPMSGMPLYADASNGKRGRVMSVGPKWVKLMTADGQDIKVPADSVISASY